MAAGRLSPVYVAVEGLETQSEICLPLAVEGRTAGVLNVESDRVAAFDEWDIVALEALAQQISDMVLMHRQAQLFNRFKAQVERQRRLGPMLGDSDAMARVFGMVESVAQSDINVSILGETGTGKELAARTIHQQSERRDKAFVAINCAALLENLFESELFGHERGAFTGATRRRIGKMELAQSGSLFLDEVSEISPSMQAKLLRAVEQKRFARVGGEREIEVDVRILSASNRPLEELQSEGRFRQDLFFRLNAVQIELPPLRERTDDIPLLAAHFLDAACTKSGKEIDHITPSALADLSAHPWPGNIRELENVINRAVLMEEGTLLTQVDIPASGGDLPGRGRPLLDGWDERPLKEVVRSSLEEIEREYLRRLLFKVRGNLSRAARIAGINRRTLYNKLETYGMSRADFVSSR